MTTRTTYAHDVAESFREGMLNPSDYAIEKLDAEDLDNQNTIQVVSGLAVVRYYQDARKREGLTTIEIARIAQPAAEHEASDYRDDDSAYDMANEDGTL